MKNCGISSNVFFSVAALTGCISVIVNMSFIDPPLKSGGITASREFKFGPTFVVKPKGKHQATIVWLHGLGDDGSRRAITIARIRAKFCHTAWQCNQISVSKASTQTFNWSQLLENLPLPNIKWICPTSPVQPLTLYDGLSTTAWFDVIDKSEDASQDVKGMDASAAYVLSLLSTEPPNVKLGVGGFSMGAATAIYTASCFGRGKLGNGTGYSTHLDVVVGLSGWLPDLSNKVGGYEVEGHAASLPILLCHGRSDDVVHFRYGEKSAEKLTSAGFRNLTFKSFHSLGHYIIQKEMDEVSSWLISNLQLEGEP